MIQLSLPSQFFGQRELSTPKALVRSSASCYKKACFIIGATTHMQSSLSAFAHPNLNPTQRYLRCYPHLDDHDFIRQSICQKCHRSVCAFYPFFPSTIKPVARCLAPCTTRLELWYARSQSLAHQSVHIAYSHAPQPHGHNDVTNYIAPQALRPMLHHRRFERDTLACLWTPSPLCCAPPAIYAGRTWNALAGGPTPCRIPARLVHLCAYSIRHVSRVRILCAGAIHRG